MDKLDNLETLNSKLEALMDHQIARLNGVLEMHQFGNHDLNLHASIEADAKLIQTVMRAKKMLNEERQVDEHPLEYNFETAIETIMARLSRPA